ncbi:unnamed protein product [Paramecium sonneborni]|uniref:Uncharacterized protein n=1 Tax=Paramecium sonneborni TaxID=65129 RepID=A0A8S1R1E4_9CILI|nr:unnamed protein product [Paramecium sonneborni]
MFQTLREQIQMKFQCLTINRRIQRLRREINQMVIMIEYFQFVFLLIERYGHLVVVIGIKDRRQISLYIYGMYRQKKKICQLVTLVGLNLNISQMYRFIMTTKCSNISIRRETD